MKKIAFFVEGATEVTFLVKLLREVLTDNKYVIETQKNEGSAKKMRASKQEAFGNICTSTEVYILVVNCTGDNTVKSYLLESRENLIKEGYSAIIGLIDLYPTVKADFHKFKQGLYFKVQQLPIPVRFVIAVMEIETWFIAEKSHFLKINSALTVERINADLGLDLDNINFEDIETPVIALRGIYGLENIGYNKRKYEVEQVVNSLDYAEIFFNLQNVVPGLGKLIKHINTFVLEG